MAAFTMKQLGSMGLKMGLNKSWRPFLGVKRLVVRSDGHRIPTRIQGSGAVSAGRPRCACPGHDVQANVVDLARREPARDLMHEGGCLLRRQTRHVIAERDGRQVRLELLSTQRRGLLRQPRPNVGEAAASSRSLDSSAPASSYDLRSLILAYWPPPVVALKVSSGSQGGHLIAGRATCTSLCVSTPTVRRSDG
jgi:hypothetical protein